MFRMYVCRSSEMMLHQSMFHLTAVTDAVTIYGCDVWLVFCVVNVKFFHEVSEIVSLRQVLKGKDLTNCDLRSF